MNEEDYEQSGGVSGSPADFTQILTEQQFLRYLESKVAEAENPEKRVAAYRVLCSQMLSILSRFEDRETFKKKFPEHPKWPGELLACTVGHVMSKPVHDWHRGAPSLYEVKVIGAEGLNPSLAAHPSRCFPEHLRETEAVVRSNIYVAQECRFTTLHFKLRRALAKMEWLQDDFAPLDSRTKASRERLQGRRAAGEMNIG